MTLSREASNVFSEGCTWLLTITLQVLGVVGSHIHVLEVTREDLLEILPAIDHVSRQVVQPGPSLVS
jgi:hypothetical protein